MAKVRGQVTESTTGADALVTMTHLYMRNEAYSACLNFPMTA